MSALAGAAIGGAFSFGSGLLAAKDAELSQARFRRRQKEGLDKARTIAGERTSKVIDSELFQGANKFLEDMFRDDIGDTPIGRDYAKGVRQAQAARGLLGGGAAVSQEASGLAAFSAQLKGSLLPEAARYSRFEEDLFQSIFAFEAPLQVAYTTGGAIAGVTPPGYSPGGVSEGLRQGVAGALGGAQIGMSFDNLERERNKRNDDRLAGITDQQFTPTASIPTSYDTGATERLSTIDRLSGLIG